MTYKTWLTVRQDERMECKDFDFALLILGRPGRTHSDFADLRDMFEQVAGDAIVCGHIHLNHDMSG